jgi:DNA-binding NarL/FixJ family response regulator
MPDIDTVVKAVNQYNEQNRGKHKNYMSYGMYMATMLSDKTVKKQKSSASKQTSIRKQNKTLSGDEILKLIEMYDDGIEVQKLAEHFDICTVTVKRILSNAGRYEPSYKRRCWTDEQIAELRSYIEAGKSNNEIAELMGRSYSSIVSILHKCGCKRQ